VTGLDDEADTLAGYRSPLHGRRPKVVAARTREAEYVALVRHVTAWREQGVEPHAIGVAARSNWMVKEAAAALNAAGLRTVSLSAKSSKDSVRVGTMHGMKGLEFQAVAVIGVADGTVPAPNALTEAAGDPLAHAQDLQRERCLLFVALTPACDHLYISYTGSQKARNSHPDGSSPERGDQWRQVRCLRERPRSPARRSRLSR
jgi:superfamily I DNA/RNA helicase